MKITFRIQYRTVWGESLCVLLSQNHIQHTVEMTTRNGEEWTGKAEFDFHPSEPICYRYAVSRQGTLVRQEFGAIPHSFYPGNLQQQHYLVEDWWRDLHKMPTAIHRLSTMHTHRNSLPACLTIPAGASPSAHSAPA